MIPPAAVHTAQAVLFTAATFAAAMAIITDTHAEPAIAATILLAIWLIVQRTGPKLYVGVVLLALVITTRVAVRAAITVMDDADDIHIATILDSLLTDNSTRTDDD